LQTERKKQANEGRVSQADLKLMHGSMLGCGGSGKSTKRPATHSLAALKKKMLPKFMRKADKGENPIARCEEP
jgi:hypothetical protein